jgi:hypothetical protein
MTFDRCTYEIAARSVLAVLDETDRFDPAHDDAREVLSVMNSNRDAESMTGRALVPAGAVGYLVSNGRALWIAASLREARELLGDNPADRDAGLGQAIVRVEATGVEPVYTAFELVDPEEVDELDVDDGTAYPEIYDEEETARSIPVGELSTLERTAVAYALAIGWNIDHLARNPFDGDLWLDGVPLYDALPSPVDGDAPTDVALGAARELAATLTDVLDQLPDTLDGDAVRSAHARARRVLARLDYADAWTRATAEVPA